MAVQRPKPASQGTYDESEDSSAISNPLSRAVKWHFRGTGAERWSWSSD